jgi:hypothetical protein
MMNLLSCFFAYAFFEMPDTENGHGHVFISMPSAPCPVLFKVDITLTGGVFWVSGCGE